MAMPDVARWTRAEVLALPDDGMRHELIDGTLIVTPDAPLLVAIIVVLIVFGIQRSKAPAKKK